MRKLTSVESVAAALPEADIDTDAILPAQFLLLLDKQGMGKHLFHGRRVIADNKPDEADRFILDRPPFDKADILVAGPRFGIGSSREQAVWALTDFGIRCIIAPSFGDIFYANCFKNGILPILLEGTDYASVLDAANQALIVKVDLETQKISLPLAVNQPDQNSLSFDIEPHRKHTLLLGLDEVGSIQAEDADDIAAFEHRQKEAAPWLYLTDEQISFLREKQARNN